MTERSMITVIIVMDDHKLLQDPNLTAQQPRRARITLCIWYVAECRY